MKTITLYYGDNGTQQFWEAPGSDGTKLKGALFFWFPNRPDLGVTGIVEGCGWLHSTTLEQALRKASESTAKRFALAPDMRWEHTGKKKMQLCDARQA